MLPDQIIQMLVQDNVDVACAAIEKAAMDRAVADVDEGLATAYEARRRHREVSVHLCAHGPSYLHCSVATPRSTVLGLDCTSVRLYLDPS